KAPGGDDLAQDVRAKYRAALIDEFQDTDPVQYQIFRQLFAPGVRPSSSAETHRPAAAGQFHAQSDTHVSAPEDGRTPEAISPPATTSPLLFLIGDPKQAIYGFRGADIFTYLEAAARVDQRYTLEENWRSETPLVRGVNAVFSFVGNPFVFDPIRFQ